MAGIKGIMPAIIILAFAYALNDLSATLNTADYIISVTESWLTPKVLPVLAFLITGFVAFSTGTSWGTYAIMIPIAVPLAFSFSANELDTVVYATIAAAPEVAYSAITARRYQTPQYWLQQGPLPIILITTRRSYPLRLLPAVSPFCSICPSA